MSTYHLHSEQLLHPEDYPLRRTFATWSLQQSATYCAFSSSVLYTDEAYFTLDGTFNQHKGELICVRCEELTSYAMMCVQRFSVNV
ncbi:hypothetical protein TNCT_362411 [Trichonephila clavata]|uniref:Uncharacterized protein n=1 Tax=Trichonephila clavata TaxID=2740835 RepID=A0A8X6FYE4_TRICU|nr:hypothetical protein TNCT_362411 [Trichonephila clavata]